MLNRERPHDPFVHLCVFKTRNSSRVLYGSLYGSSVALSWLSLWLSLWLLCGSHFRSAPQIHALGPRFWQDEYLARQHFMGVLTNAEGDGFFCTSVASVCSYDNNVVKQLYVYESTMAAATANVTVDAPTSATTGEYIYCLRSERNEGMVCASLAPLWLPLWFPLWLPLWLLCGSHLRSTP